MNSTTTSIPQTPHSSFRTPHFHPLAWELLISMYFKQEVSEMPGLFSDIATTVIAKSLDMHGMRHRIIANNIANVETPGYIRTDVSFDAQLKEALDQPNPTIARNMIIDRQPEVKEDLSSPIKPNGNNVNIDKEMAEMTKNTTDYETLLRLMGMKGAMMLTAITEGRK